MDEELELQGGEAELRKHIIRFQSRALNQLYCLLLSASGVLLDQSAVIMVSCSQLASSFSG
jgi:hypothetical protein